MESNSSEHELRRLRWMEEELGRMVYRLRRDAVAVLTDKPDLADGLRAGANQVEAVLEAAWRKDRVLPDPESLAANLASLNEVVAEMTAKVSGDPEFTQLVSTMLRNFSSGLGYEFQGS